MKVKHYDDLDGNRFMEIISKQYLPLKELENEHAKIGRKTWLNLYNIYDGTWILTVQMVEKVA